MTRDTFSAKGDPRPTPPRHFQALSPGKLQASCNHRNHLQAAFAMGLGQDQWLTVTYACHLRAGTEGDDEFLDLKGLPREAYVTALDETPSRLFLYLFHGRDTVNEQMDDFGDDAREQPDYPGDPTADAFVISEAGVLAVDYNEDGTWSETLVPYVNGLIEYRGRFYGDLSIEPVGNGGHVPAKES